MADSYLKNWETERAASSEQVAEAEAGSASNPCITIIITADEIGKMTADHYSPYMYRQRILEKLKFAGAPVEGVLQFKLAHGAVARVKPDPGNPQDFFTFMWIPAEYAAAIASAGRTC